MLNNIGLPGLLLIAVVVLVLFGRGKISSLMGEVGKGITAFKKGVSDGAKELDDERAEEAKDVTPEDMGWTEMLVIGVVALIVVGPKELPVLFRNIGRFAGKARGMAREFSRAMEQAADETGVKDIQSTIRTATNPLGSALDGVKDAARSVTDLNLDPESETGKLAEERAEAARKIKASTARKAAERKAKEAAEALKAAEAAEADLAKVETSAPAPDKTAGDA